MKQTLAELRSGTILHNLCGVESLEIAQLIDHTLLKPDATRADVDRLCQEALAYRFHAVCVNASRVRQAVESLRRSEVRVATTVGFPLGATTTITKVRETEQALEDGAREIDMVMNIGALKDGDTSCVLDDIGRVADLCHDGDALCKVILETCLLTDAEKARACAIALDAGVDFVKTSTGFAGGGATTADVALLSGLVKSKGVGVKAAGGIRCLADLQAMVAAGATRIGTSAGLKIIQEAAGENPKNS